MATNTGTSNERIEDFGFSFISQDEFDAQEQVLKDQIISHAQQAGNYEDKLKRVVALIDPFLSNLSADPSKVYIKWANRATKVQEFRKKIHAIIEE